MNFVTMVSCEHASNNIPPKYTHLFTEAEELLKTHRGWDIGALPLYHMLCEKNWVFAHKAAEWSRLLIDLNRSITHLDAFSSITKQLPQSEKTAIIETYYQPYRTWLIEHMQEQHKQHVPIRHLSLHSFTPILNDHVRNCDIGLLYDPKRYPEINFCERFKIVMQKINLKWVIRKNYPYLGIGNAFTSYMRKQIPEEFYTGIEIEMNQKHFTPEGQCKTTLLNDIVEVLEILSKDEYATILS